jgi:chemotaxis protein histidine kinase CheA
VDEELADLIPLFLGEARERLARLHELLPQVEAAPQALHGARRELHTLEGSSRMLGLADLATLCRDGQSMLADDRAIPLERLGVLLGRVADALARVADETPRAANGETTAVPPAGTA